MFPMNPSDMVLHVVHTTEDPFAIFMRAGDARVVARLVTIAVLLGREASLLRLGTIFVAAEEGLGVTAIVLAQITASGEAG